MNEEFSQEAQMLEGFMGAIGKECLECGEISPSDAEICEFCGMEFEMEEDDPTLSILQAVGVGDLMAAAGVDPDMQKVPLAQAENLIMLKNTVEMVRMNQITLDEYRKNITKILNIARNGVELFSSDIVKKQVSQFDESFQSLIWDTAALYEDFMNGCLRMLEYQGGIDILPANEGLEIIETSLRNMDSLHDEVIDVSRDVEEEPDED